MVTGDVGHACGQVGQGVEVGREQGAAAVGVVEVVQASVGEREPVFGRGAAADFVHYDLGREEDW